MHTARRTRPAHTTALVVAGVVVVLVGVALWLALASNPNATDPINRPNIPSPMPSDIPDDRYQIQCGAEDPADCWDYPGKLSVTMVPGKPIGSSPLAGPPVALTVDPPTDWYIEAAHHDYFDLRTRTRKSCPTGRRWYFGGAEDALRRR